MTRTDMSIPIEVKGLCLCIKCDKLYTNISGFPFKLTEDGKGPMISDLPCSKGGTCEAQQALYDVKKVFNECFEDNSKNMIVVECPSCEASVTVSKGTDYLKEGRYYYFEEECVSCGTEFSFEGCFEVTNKEVFEDEEDLM